MAGICESKTLRRHCVLGVVACILLILGTKK
jgi:hypothetical protein